MTRVCICLLSLLTLAAVSQGIDAATYKIDEQKNIVFIQIEEQLPLSKAEIFASAVKYLEEAYKDTRYTISTLSPESGMVIGEGTINSFAEQSSAITMKSVNLDFKVRVDAMDGRARIQFIAREYKTLKLKDMGGKEAVSVLIAQMQPIGDDNSDKGLYKKAFDELQNLATRILGQVGQHLRDTQPTPKADDNW